MEINEGHARSMFFFDFHGFFASPKQGGVSMEMVTHEEQDVMVKTEISFDLEHDALLNALTLCAKIAPRSGAIPVLQTIKFKLQNNKLYLTAMDIDQAVVQSLDVENTSMVSGEFLFPVREGIDLVRKLPKGNLTFTQKDSLVYISYGSRGGQANLKVLSAEEYPELPELIRTEVFKVPVDVLRKGSLASRFAAVDEKNPNISGIHIYNREGKIAFAATDRHRVYNYESSVAISDQEKFQNAIIPATNFKQIVDSIRGNGEVVVTITSSHLILKDQSTIYFGRLVEGVYPDLSQILASNKGKTVLLSRAELDDSLNRALSLDTSNNRVTLEVEDEGEFVIHTESQTGEVREKFSEVKIDDDFPAVKFNGRFLKDALLVGDREAKRIRLTVTGPSNPAFMEMDGDASVVIVVLPVR